MKNSMKYYRDLNNITQQKLAQIVNCSESQIRNIENNRSIPNVYLAIKIMKALNVEDITKLFIED